MKKLTQVAEATLITLLYSIVAYCDIHTGPEVPFSSYYFILIAYTTWKSDILNIFCIAFASYIIRFGVINFVPYELPTKSEILLYNIQAFISFLSLITLLIITKRQFNNLIQLSMEDPLTHVYNSTTFKNSITKYLKKDNKSNYLSVVFLDIDDFKSINDKFGHTKGDELLITTSKIISNNIREGDFVGRLGGDEFGIFLINTNKELCDKILTRLQEKLKQETGISCSIGAVLINMHSKQYTTEQLLNIADKEMYKIKLSSKNGRSIILKS